MGEFKQEGIRGVEGAIEVDKVPGETSTREAAKKIIALPAETIRRVGRAATDFLEGLTDTDDFNDDKGRP